MSRSRNLGRLLPDPSGIMPVDNIKNGSVVQVVQNSYSTATSTTSGSFIYSGLSAIITPTLATNKILILVTAAMQGTGNGGIGLAIYRNSTIVMQDTQPYISGYWIYGNNWRLKIPLSYMDSPNTINALTYGVYMQAYQTTTIMSTENSPSYITLMEIKS